MTMHMIVPASLMIFQLILFFFLPLIFQLLIGHKALRGKIRMRFWVACLISIICQFLLTVTLLISMANNITQSGNHDGLGMAIFGRLGILMIAIILIVIGTQLIIRRKKEKKRPLTPAKPQ